MKTRIVLLILIVFASAVGAQEGPLPDGPLACAEIVVPTADQGREYSFKMSLSPDGETLAVLRTEHSRILFYSTMTDRLVDSLDPGLDRSFGLAWSPDGNQIAVSGEIDDTHSIPLSYDIVIWDLETKREAARQTNALATSVAWSPTAPLIALASRIDSAVIWDFERDTVTQIGREAEVLAWKPDGSALVGSWETSYGWIWYEETDRLVVSPQRYSFDALAWSPDGRFLALSSSTVGQYVYDVVEHPDTLFSLDASVFHFVDAPVSSLAWSPIDNYLAAASRWGLVLWDVQAGFEATTFFYTGNTPPFAGNIPAFVDVAWMPDGETLLALSDSGTIYTWDIPCLVALDQN